MEVHIHRFPVDTSFGGAAIQPTTLYLQGKAIDKCNTGE